MSVIVLTRHSSMLSSSQLDATPGTWDHAAPGRSAASRAVSMSPRGARELLFERDLRASGRSAVAVCAQAHAVAVTVDAQTHK